jgi:hypothetical protein
MRTKHFVNDLAQPLPVGQRQRQVLDQARKFRRNRNLRSGQNHGPAIGGELLPHVAQTPHHHRVLHVAMQVFQNESRFNGDALEIGEHLSRIPAVVKRLGAFGKVVDLASAITSRWKGALLDRGDRADSAASQPAGDGPLESREI